MILVLGGYALMSAVAFGAYGIDKRRAARGEWRIPEATLHVLELFGGWPGAFVAQGVFRHKRQKTSYAIVFWGIVAVHFVAWVWWLRAAGSA